MWVPREDQDGDPSHEFPHPCRGFSHLSCGLYKICGGMMSFPQRGLGHNLAYVNWGKSNGPIEELVEPGR
jgi:hypothetical protein